MDGYRFSSKETQGRGGTVLDAKQRPEYTQTYCAKNWWAYGSRPKGRSTKEPLLWRSAMVCPTEKEWQLLQRTGRSTTITRFCFLWRILSTSASHRIEIWPGASKQREFWSVLTIMCWSRVGKSVHRVALFDLHKEKTMGDLKVKCKVLQ